MANSDYINRDRSFGFCPVAYLASGIGPLTTSVTMTGYSEPRPDGIRIGMAAMIDQEIVSVISRTGNSLTLGRGCCDTVPAAHDTGATIWFFDDSIGRDLTEYAGTETVSVKAMPRSLSGSVPKSHAVPKQITFSLRYARPYPPGNVKVNGDPWFADDIYVDAENDTLTLTWSHRDRITQQDQLVAHGASSIGPEPGVTYTVRIYKADNTLLRTVTGIAGTTWSYSAASMSSDFDVYDGIQVGYLMLSAQRDTILSFQSYRIDFEFDAATAQQEYGLGYRLGLHVGGYPASLYEHPENVILQLHLDEDPIVDTGINNLDVTNLGTAAITTSDPKFGAGSLTTYGIGNALRIGGTGALPMGFSTFAAPNPWTVEAQVFIDDAETSSGVIFALISTSGFPLVTPEFALVYEVSGSNITLNCFNQGVNLILPRTTRYPAPIKGRWAHVAAVHDDGKLRLFVNGKSIIYRIDGADTYDWVSFHLTIPADTEVFVAGSPFNSFASTPGSKIDEVRVHNRVVWTGSYDPFFNTGSGEPPAYAADFNPPVGPSFT